jgi:hypothetical protein
VQKEGIKIEGVVEANAFTEQQKKQEKTKVEEMLRRGLCE